MRQGRTDEGTAQSTAERFWDASARIERLFWTPSVADGEALPEALEDALEDGLDAVVGEHLGYDIERDELEEEWGYLASSGKLPTFFAQAATPSASRFRTTDSGGEMWSSSWGSYYTAWLCADTLDALTDKVEAWAAERLAGDRTRESDSKRSGR